MKRDLVPELVGTFFYAGYFPAAPGTFASAIGILLVLGLWRFPFWYIAVAVVITVLGFWQSGKMEAITGKKDPGCVVVDEVAGMMISCFFLPPVPPVLWTAFFLFRAFDMFKIYPVNKYEALSGGTGIMLDDVVAGLYTCLTMHIAIRLAGII